VPMRRRTACCGVMAGRADGVSGQSLERRQREGLAPSNRARGFAPLVRFAAQAQQRARPFAICPGVE
jgi:hypothetical protein